MNTNQFPPPIRLTELVESVGVDGVKELAAQIGALEIAAKANQVWRFVLDGAIIIGYTNSAVVAGRDELTMRRAAVLLSIAGGATDPPLLMQARALDLALTARALVDARRGDDYLARVLNLVAHCAELEEADEGALIQLLEVHAPHAAIWLGLLLAVYLQGFADAADGLTDEPEVEPWLPDIPDDVAAVTLSA